MGSLSLISLSVSATFISTGMTQSFLTVYAVNIMLTLTFVMVLFFFPPFYSYLTQEPMYWCNKLLQSLLCYPYKCSEIVLFLLQLFSPPFVPLSKDSSVLFISANCLLIPRSFCCAISLYLFIPLPNLTFISSSWSVSEIISSYLEWSFFLF